VRNFMLRHFVDLFDFLALIPRCVYIAICFIIIILPNKHVRACVRACACVTQRLLSCERTPDDTGTAFAYRTAITEPGGILPALNDELVSARDDKVPLAENGAQTRDLRCFDVVPR
jgi:hypothetical protein